MVVDRRHQEDPAMEDAEAEHLDHHAERFDHEEKAHEEQQQLHAGHDGHAGYGRADAPATPCRP